MLVLFKPSPQSILKAFLASKVYKGKPVEAKEGSTFYFEETVDSDKLDYDSLYGQYKESYGGIDFLEDEKLWEIMEDEIFWASRFAAHDRLNLIFAVLAQIEKKGTKAYLAQETPEAKEMKDRVRRVTGELRRAKQFISFTEDVSNKVVIGRGSFEHNIVDLVLRHFSKRYPGCSIVILDELHAHICYKDEILIESRDKFPDKPGRKEAARYWAMLSDIKHLESRRDPQYSLATPRNYWKWIADGAQVYGAIPRATLDDFTA